MGLSLGETLSYLRGATCHVGTGPKRPQDTTGHSGHTSGRATLLTPMRSKSSKSPRLGASEGLDDVGTAKPGSTSDLAFCGNKGTDDLMAWLSGWFARNE